MKKLLTILLLSLLTINANSQDTYVPEKFEPFMLKTKTGAKVIHNGEKNSFTFDLNGKSVRPSGLGAMLVDDNIIQSDISPFTEKFELTNMSIENQKGKILNFKDDKIDYFKNSLKTDISNSKYEWLEINDKLFLFWNYDMKSNDEIIRKEICVIMICFDQFLHLRTNYEDGNKNFESKKALLSNIAETVQLNNHVMDIKKLSTELNE